MGVGLLRVYAATMASGTSLTGALDLGRGYMISYLQVPSLSTNAAVKLLTSDSSTGTYRYISQLPVNSGTSQTYDFLIASGANNRVVPIPAGLQYLKIETTGAVNDGATFKVICLDNT